MKNIFQILFFFLLSAGSFAQHYPLNSQYMLNGLAINPAYAGSHEVFTISLLYRNQWTGFNGAPVTQTLCGHAPLKNKNIAVGVIIFSDKIGVTSQNGIYTNYAYRIEFPEGKLSLGLKAGLNILHSRWEEIETIEPNDEQFMSNSDIHVVPNFGTGLYYYCDKYFIGLSVPLLLSYSEDTGKDILKFYHDFKNYNIHFHSGIKFIINNNFYIMPSFLLKYIPGTNTQIDINCKVGYKNMYCAGFSYRTSDAVVALLEYQLNSQFMIGYAYDITISELNRYNNGTHEIMLRYFFGYKLNASNPRF